jgi:hypothetical protein
MSTVTRDFRYWSLTASEEFIHYHLLSLSNTKTKTKPPHSFVAAWHRRDNQRQCLKHSVTLITKFTVIPAKPFNPRGRVYRSLLLTSTNPNSQLLSLSVTLSVSTRSAIIVVQMLCYHFHDFVLLPTNSIYRVYQLPWSRPILHSLLWRSMLLLVASPCLPCVLTSTSTWGILNVTVESLQDKIVDSNHAVLEQFLGCFFLSFKAPWSRFLSCPHPLNSTRDSHVAGALSHRHLVSIGN